MFDFCCCWESLGLFKGLCDDDVETNIYIYVCIVLRKHEVLKWIPLLLFSFPRNAQWTLCCESVQGQICLKPQGFMGLAECCGAALPKLSLCDSEDRIKGYIQNVLLLNLNVLWLRLGSLAAGVPVHAGKRPALREDWHSWINILALCLQKIKKSVYNST